MVMHRRIDNGAPVRDQAGHELGRFASAFLLEYLVVEFVATA
jgi:hypothetical protein